MGDLADLETLGTAAVYVVVIGFVFVECALLIGFFLPGDTLLFAGGLVAADAARGVHLGWLLVGVLVAAIVGEIVGYVIGARMGLPVLRNRRGRVITPERVARAEAFTERYGVLAIIAARWIPWVRTFAPLLAGATGMSWPKFMLANVVGALCWGPTLLVAGYLAASVPWVEHVSVAVAGVAIVATTAVGLVRWRRARPRET
ncbi:MAG: DedA protein [uncultured Corynebacteriales bacterium]|uniref:DedA protein n=1 Tax=uncultured Mycobacteriales bacterium TaxID=581187 RepID=A0A6J4HXZ7_9ACTN|nr:MAG: DedA protein [uncultured Corynebacteriales bacterium]